MSFSIRFLTDEVSLPIAQEEVSIGEIKIDDFSERFRASLSYWDQKKYENHWKRAIEGIVDNTTSTSCLITSMYDPSIANFIIWWPFYRVGNIVYIQNQIFFLESLQEPFNENTPFIH